MGAKVRGLGKSDERKRELQRAAEIKTAEHVAERLGHMKGALMKLGQMASYIDQALPEHVRAAFAELQQNAPPMSFELAESTLRSELGDLRGFAEIDPEPIAAASIGQVHRATTRDGRDVAVKIQYPGVDEAIRADLANSDLLFGLLGTLFNGLDPGPVADELRERLTEELDYQIEADNQRAFLRYYRDHPVIHVPNVVDSLSSRRVLTTDFVDGAGFDEVCQWSADQRDMAGETLYRFVFSGIYQLAMFNGDPHPGNYRFGADGSVTFLDFGLCKRFSPAELGVFEDMITHMVIRPDLHAFQETLRAVGFLPDGVVFPAGVADDYFSHFYELVVEAGPRTVTPEYSSGMIRRFVDLKGEHRDIITSINLPRSMVIVQRINLGMYALLGDLHATNDWRHLAETIWPFVPSPEPQTAIGAAVAEWEVRRARDGHQR